MKMTGWIVGIYACIVLAGGLIGYVKAGSTPSLVCGITFGALLLSCCYAIFKGRISAQYIALGTAFILDGFFTHRFAKTLHFFPSGFMSLLSLVVIIVIALKIRKSYRLR